MNAISVKINICLQDGSWQENNYHYPGNYSILNSMCSYHDVLPHSKI